MRVIVCVNVRRSRGGSCGTRCNTGRMIRHLKKRLRRVERRPTSPALDRVEVKATRCLLRCDEGPVLVIQPGNQWYRYACEADIDELVCEHIGQGRVVERLALRDDDFTDVSTEAGEPSS